MVKQIDYNSIPWSEYFYASTDSKSGVKWKVERRSGAGYQKVNADVGSDAGTVQYKNNGTATGWKVVLNKTTYLVHRILYVLLHGSIDSTKMIDHLNGIPTDNTPSNLVLKDRRGNAQNVKKSVANTSGITGVRFTIARGGFEYWMATWYKMDGKKKSRHFSITKHGYETAKQLAINHRNLQISLLNAAGASYTSRHCGLTPGTTPAISPVQPT
jgi:hypothetical protein